MLPEVEGVAAIAGWRLSDWQRGVIRDWSRIDSSGKFVHRSCGASVPRQAGKSVVAIVWVTFLVAVMGYSVLWTDHNYSTTCEMLRRFRKVFGARPGDPSAPRCFNKLLRAASSKTSQEMYELTNGGRLCFSTRTESASLGFSFDVIVYDEAQLLTTEQMQTLQPTTSSGPHHNTQTIMVGTPTRAGSLASKFRELRDRAISAPGDDVCWVEWGVSEVGDVLDESRYYEVNPSLAAGVADIDAIKSSISLMAADKLAVAQEYLGYWVPGATSAVLTAEEWGACAVSADDAPKDGGVVAYGVKFSPDGALVALAACRRTDTGSHVELIRTEGTVSGVGWLADWLAERTDRAAAVAIDGRSGAGALVERLASSRVPPRYVMRPRAGDVTTAASMLLEGVRGHGLTHIPGTDLDTSATSATRRKVGSDGGWAFGGEASLPIEAASLAMWAAATTKRNPARKGRVA